MRHEFTLYAEPVCPKGDDGLRIVLKRENGATLVEMPFSPVADVPMAERARIAGFEVNVVVHANVGPVGGVGRVVAHVPWMTVEQIVAMVRERFGAHEVAGVIADAILEQQTQSIPIEPEVDGADASLCPRCGEWVPGEYEFGVLRHEACGWCAHPTLSVVKTLGVIGVVAFVCDLCGDRRDEEPPPPGYGSGRFA